MGENTRLTTLFGKYLQDSLDELEWAEFVNMLEDKGNEKILKDLIQSHYANEANEQDAVSAMVNNVWNQLDATIGKKQEAAKVVSIVHRKGWYKIALAASFILVIGLLTTLYLINYKNKFSFNVARDASHILPGGNKAYLFLSNGERISLNDKKDGIVVSAGRIAYNDGKELGLSNENKEMVLATPRGGNYQLVLPDGSRVWLNAASSLRYPTRFSNKERVVELIGEAFFSVAKNARVPFIVRANHQQITVHGTKFNINAYPETPVTTTLVEGSVSITSDDKKRAPLFLTPGFKSLIKNDSLIAIPVDTKISTSWKEGMFSFRDATVNEVMTQLSIWYNVDISYPAKMPNAHVNGEIYKNIPLSDALDILNKLNISCFYNGKNIVVR